MHFFGLEDVGGHTNWGTFRFYLLSVVINTANEHFAAVINTITQLF
jgi:hypothetical protein